MREKIAIIGMSGIFPGAKDIESFWKVLLEEDETITEANEIQFNGPPEYFNSNKKGVVDKCYSTWGGYIEEPDYALNATFQAKPELKELDQIYRWSLFVASEALKNAGYLENKEILKRCGLLLGSLTMPTRETANRMSRMYARYFENRINQITGNQLDWPLTTFQQEENVGFQDYPISTASLVAKELHLGGEQYCLDAACASVHYAMRFASDMLIRNEADIMLAGAVSCADPLFVHEGFSIFTAYPEPGKKQAPLDKNSGGMVSAEGAGIFVLKRLDDALHDGDDVHAVINSIGLSNDGKGKYLLSPLSEGQVRAFDRTYEATEVDKKDINYIECHATGTALGDQTEIDSISTYFNGHVPKLGTVKTNIGHLLTASGIPSVLKVIKALKDQKIPASLRITDPVSTNRYSGDSIIVKQEKWDNTTKRYAAINAFGFGGTNAHMIVEDDKNIVKRNKQASKNSTHLAVIGMDAYFGKCSGLQEFSQLVCSDENNGIPLPEDRWKGMENDSVLLKELNIEHLKSAYGGYIEDFEMDLKRFRILPNEITKIEKQHTLMLKVADNALRNAGFDHVNKPSKKVAVIIAMDTDPAGHQYFGRWHLEWQLNKLAESGQLDNDPEKKKQLLAELKSWMYNLDKVELSVSMHTSFIGNIMASRIASLWNFTGPVLTLTAGETGVAKAIKLAHRLMDEGEADAAVVGAVDFAASLENIAQKGESYFDGFMPGEGAGAIVLETADIHKKAENSLSFVNISQDISQYEFLEISGNETTDKGKTELENILGKKHPKCPVSNVKSQIGHSGNAAGMASIIRSFTNLSRGIPPISTLGEKKNSLDSSRRKAMVSLFDGNEHFALEVTTLVNTHGKVSPQRLGELQHRMLLVHGKSNEELITQLDALISRAKNTSLQQMALDAYDSFLNRKKEELVASIIATDSDSLAREVKGLRAFLSSANANSEWQSPSGSYFTHKPLGNAKKVAIGYPGSATAYKGVGKELLSVFPHLKKFMTVDWSSELNEKFENLLYHSDVPEKDLINDNRALILAGEGIAAAYTDLIQNVFGLKPEIAYGYSMGEASAMFCAQGIWNQQHLGQRFLESNLFLEEVAGEKRSLQTFLNTSKPVNDIWKSYVLIYDINEIQSKIKSYPDVYITFINTPTECQISGNPESCEKLIDELGATYFATWDNTILHHDFIKNDREKLVDLHSMPVMNGDHQIKFYSSVQHDWIPIESSAIAQNAAELNCKAVDFPSIIEDLYEKGVGIFVETGPGNTLSRWIAGILGNRDYTTITLNRKGASDWKQLLGQLGKLVSHHVNLELDSIFTHSDSNEAELPVRVKMGGPSLESTPAIECIKESFPNGSKKEAIWDEDDLHEFAVGKIANVFGSDYEIIDSYNTRVRLPAPPYLLVSRVTKLEAKVNEFKPSYIQTEYDVPFNAWYSIDGQIPWAVLTESGQCDLLLISYLGIDFEAKGERLYRLLAAKFDFHNHMPEEGDTLRFDIHINGFSRSGATLLFFFSYDCYVGDKLIVKMTDGCAGFFTKDELEKGAGITYTKEQQAERKNAQKEQFDPPLICQKNAFSKEDLIEMTKGNFKDSFGADFDQGNSNPSLKLPPQKIAMFDRVIQVDPRGGHWGLGVVTAEKDLKMDDWYFTCHFIDDHVLAGSLEAEGGSQMVQFFMLYLGLWKFTKNARFQPLQGVTQKVQCRKETPPMNEAITYRLEVKKIGTDPDPYVLGDVELIQHGVTIVLFENIGLALKEK